jgi:transposase InsO family protein
MVVDLCNTCLKGKKHHKKFPKEGGTRITNILGLIYYDICGPIQTSTHFGCTYFITFIDDYTRYTTTYFLHHKFEALAKFKQFVEIQINNQIEVLRANNGCEYKSNEFTQFCKES